MDSSNGLNIQYISKFLKDPTRYFQDLEREIVYLADPCVRVYGKTFPIPRMVAAYGDDNLTYTFSGLTLRAEPWTPTLLTLKGLVEGETGQAFNFVLVNRYRSGRDKIGRHRDDEPCISRRSSIASISLGAERLFVFSRHGEKSVKMMLEDGSLLVLKPPTNERWYHELPKSRTMEPRINLTFRKHNEGGEGTV